MQAMILAAGMGKRLKELTNNATKCMVKVNGVTMIERTLTQLDRLNLKRIVLVIGYKGNELREFVGTLPINTPIEYVENTVYDKTNNIYSLYLAKDKLIEDDTLLLESDLVFEQSLLTKLVENPYPSLALVAKHESWMDGTCMKIDEDCNIKAMISKKDFDFKDAGNYYKTVNIYKFGKEFSESHYVPFLEAYCKALGNNEYYEQVLKVISLLDNPGIKVLPLDNDKWYEIDDEQDLDIAESIFADYDEKYDKFMRRYGGYWRYPGVLDFCYLVNPYYPSQKMIDEIQVNFRELLMNYPSGMDVNSLVAAKTFGLRKNQVCVGNGAAELIKSLTGMIQGKIGVIYPSFEEYANRIGKERVVPYMADNRDFAYQAQEIMDFFNDKEIEALIVVNPDNPTGNYIKRADILTMADWAEKKGIKLVVDESFSDFVEDVSEVSLLDRELLIHTPSLIVVKSISKSYGVPGLRLGIIATNDTELIEKMKKDVSIWNINSFGEFYFQIAEKYKDSYRNALVKFKDSRRQLVEGLKANPNLRVIPSEANYVMCEVSGETDSRELAKKLLYYHDILIKDLSKKHGFEGRSYIRVAVRTTQENEKLINAINKELGK